MLVESSRHSRIEIIQGLLGLSLGLLGLERTTLDSGTGLLQLISLQCQGVNDILGFLEFCLLQLQFADKPRLEVLQLLTPFCDGVRFRFQI